MNSVSFQNQVLLNSTTPPPSWWALAALGTIIVERLEVSRELRSCAASPAGRPGRRGAAGRVCHTRGHTLTHTRVRTHRTQTRTMTHRISRQCSSHSLEPGAAGTEDDDDASFGHYTENPAFQECFGSFKTSPARERLQMYSRGRKSESALGAPELGSSNGPAGSGLLEICP